MRRQSIVKRRVSVLQLRGARRCLGVPICCVNGLDRAAHGSSVSVSGNERGPVHRGYKADAGKEPRRAWVAEGPGEGRPLAILGRISRERLSSRLRQPSHADHEEIERRSR